jgi:hypothetical protein
VRLIANRAEGLDEAARQRLLLAEARRIAAPRLLIALDADELLTAGAWHCAEWTAMLAAPPGTGFRFRLHNLRPDFGRCWQEPCEGLWGFMDDGSEHQGATLHGRRLPLPAPEAVTMLDEIEVLHYQFTDWRRMRSKHRWYQCLERVLHPERGPLAVYRQYHHMDAVDHHRMRPLPPSWLAGYEEIGIDMRRVEGGPPYWFDREVLAMIDRRGARHFRRQAIWEHDWAALAERCGYGRRERFRDPRTPRERMVHAWLRLSQPRHRRRWARRVDAWLERRGW